MRKDRLEMFSDGVFAIVITLLILDIRIPDVRASEIGPALYHLLPRVFTYVMSFFVVALYWLGHHRMSHLVRSVDGPFVWLNMLWLLFVSVIPFPTALLGRYPLEHIPIAVYGVDLILANITGFFVTLRLKDRPDLTTEPVGGSHIRSIIPAYIVTNGAYLIAIFIGGVLPIGSYVIYAGVLIWLAIRYSRSPHPFHRGARGKEN
jgi:uncharacterized membrane protein